MQAQVDAVVVSPVLSQKDRGLAPATLIGVLVQLVAHMCKAGAGEQCATGIALHDTPILSRWQACECMHMAGRAAVFSVSGQQSGAALLDSSKLLLQPGDLIMSGKCCCGAVGRLSCCARAWCVSSTQRGVLCLKCSHFASQCLHACLAVVEAGECFSKLSLCSSSLISSSVCMCTCGCASMGAGCACAAGVQAEGGSTMTRVAHGGVAAGGTITFLLSATGLW